MTFLKFDLNNLHIRKILIRIQMMSEPTFTELDYDTASKANQQMSMSFLLVKKLSPDAILPMV